MSSHKLPAYRTPDLAAGVFPSDAQDIAEQALAALLAKKRLPDIVQRVTRRVFREGDRPMQRIVTLGLLSACAGLGVISEVSRAPSDIASTWPRIQESIEDWFIQNDSSEALLERIGTVCLAA